MGTRLVGVVSHKDDYDGKPHEFKVEHSTTTDAIYVSYDGKMAWAISTVEDYGKDVLKLITGTFISELGFNEREQFLKSIGLQVIK